MKHWLAAAATAIAATSAQGGGEAGAFEAALRFEWTFAAAERVPPRLRLAVLPETRTWQRATSEIGLRDLQPMLRPPEVFGLELIGTPALRLGGVPLQLEAQGERGREAGGWVLLGTLSAVAVVGALIAAGEVFEDGVEEGAQRFAEETVVPGNGDSDDGDDGDSGGGGTICVDDLCALPCDSPTGCPGG